MSCKKIPVLTNEPEHIKRIRLLDIIALEGGADGWVENSINLMKSEPKKH